MDELNDQRQQRIKKLDTLRGLGVEPHGSRFAVQDRAADLLSLHGEKSKERLEQEKIAVTLRNIISNSSACVDSEKRLSRSCRTAPTECRSI